MKHFKTAIVLCGLAVFSMITACGSGAQEDGGNQKTAETADRKKVDLRKYSLDQDSRTEDDFDLIGKLIHAEDDQMTLKIKDRELIIPKSKHFKSEEDHDDLIGKLIQVEVDGKTQEAEEAELMPQAKADENGVYEREADGGQKVIGTLVSESDHDVTIQTEAGDKTYQKASGYERDIAEAPEKLKGRTVRLEIQKDGKVESLDFEAEDQKLDWYKE
ncbi:hypothetical protein P9D34_18760 [Bacillus swezeyi]|uniref:Lipoprotein n=1 Tax=Bacillus swezeyi TaxID=1925020 RepID=A0A1R1RQI3_9BACI|nr:hypothetical protein [Bacillus swezeyi]MEC1262423.1 hypothetical protein [Bacillus swezeyi]MED2926868.1 hypothetical protein [Bacillus swezeyi]MED2943354.1 hypothetical protein [Bacillus swezeyi]MED2965570.1 hypothetical protein [Bacillus swezeyi]MED3071027.1 hypothetical protein [Bacillus swezeyi]